ncbi:MAG: S16 family serine protease [Actinomycetota bacterium]|nr:S16 family serine protease [Actinomycetota bacterium]
MILTTNDSVPEPAEAVRAPRRVHRWWAVPLAVVGVAAVAAPVVLSFVPAKYFATKPHCVRYEQNEAGEVVCTKSVRQDAEFALVPANAEAVSPRLAITGVPLYDSPGQIYFVTVREQWISVIDWFVTRDNPAARLRSYEEKYPDNQTPAQLDQLGQRQMRSAQDNAVYVALKAAGFDVQLTPGEVIIDGLVCLEANEANTECVTYSPADEVLDPGDVLTKVNGVALDTIDDLGPIMADVEPGAMIPVEFQRDGVSKTGEIETILAPGEDEPRTIIGFRPIDTTTVTLPDGLGVQFNTENINGPSAGLAFTLELIDELTEGDLMGGNRVAVTGTIDVNGNVGAIGGLNSKASAVLQVGVKYFLVPTGQGEDGIDGLEGARAVVGDAVELIPVATLAEALAALERIGGDPVQLVDAPTDTTG